MLKDLHADKPHDRVHVVITNDEQGQHLKMYHRLKQIITDPHEMWESFIQPILDGGKPSSEILSKIRNPKRNKRNQAVTIPTEKAVAEQTERQDGVVDDTEVPKPFSVKNRTKSSIFNVGGHQLIKTKKGEALKPNGSGSSLEKSFMTTTSANSTAQSSFSRGQHSVGTLLESLSSLEEKPDKKEGHIDLSMEDLFGHH